MGLGILALCTSAAPALTGAAVVGNADRPTTTGALERAAAHTAAPGITASAGQARLVRQGDGTVHVVTTAEFRETSDGRGKSSNNANEVGRQSPHDDVAGEGEGIHVRWGRSLDLVGRPIDFSRPIGSSLTSARPAPYAFPPGAMPSSMPVAARALTSGYGMREHPLLGIRRAHLGVDLAASSGSPIVATSDGVVSVADWRGGYGLSVSLEHGGGIETRYGHMSRLNVFVGQTVHKGDVIGFVGSTGLSTGPHLHYEVRVNGQPVNPLPLLKPR